LPEPHRHSCVCAENSAKRSAYGCDRRRARRPDGDGERLSDQGRRRVDAESRSDEAPVESRKTAQGDGNRHFRSEPTSRLSAGG
jgi:hypothetical protein